LVSAFSLFIILADRRLRVDSLVLNMQHFTRNMSKSKRLSVVGIVAASVGAIAGRVVAYRAMRNDLDAIREHISRGLSSASTIRNHSVSSRVRQRDSISPPQTRRHP
jgi:hypothetical protein